MFITIEGPDGAGKTTQISLLEDHLRQRGLKVLRTREPGGTDIGTRIRRIILDPSSSNMSAITEALLYAADRAQHVDEVVRPALKDGLTVISDRYVDSSVAYQGCGLGLDVSLIKKISEIATDGLMPDLTILLDIDSQEGLRRAFKARKDVSCLQGVETKEVADRIEERDLEFHRSVRKSYLQLAKESPERYRILEISGRSVSEVAHLIADTVDKFISSN